MASTVLIIDDDVDVTVGKASSPGLMLVIDEPPVITLALDLTVGTDVLVAEPIDTLLVTEQAATEVTVEAPGGVTVVTDVTAGTDDVLFITEMSRGPQGVPGLRGERGPEGPPGASAVFYRHEQLLPERVWVIHHNMGYRPGGVVVTDSMGTVIIGSLAYPDNNTVVIYFSAPVSGEAYLT